MFNRCCYAFAADTCVAYIHTNSAKAHVSRSMLERLREDVRWFAGDQNAKTSPELVGFSDSEVNQYTLLYTISYISVYVYL
jgi:hypothetical protein